MMRRLRRDGPFENKSLQFSSFQSLQPQSRHPIITTTSHQTYRPNRAQNYHTNKQHQISYQIPRRKLQQPDPHRQLMDVIQVRLHKIHTREHLKTQYSVHKDEAKRYMAKQCSRNSNYCKKMMLVSQNNVGTRVFIPSRLTQQAHRQETVKKTESKRSAIFRPSTAKQTGSKQATECSHMKFNSRVIESSKDTKRSTKKSKYRQSLSGWDTEFIQEPLEEESFQPFLKTYY